MRGTTDEFKALAMQAQEMIEKALKRASNIVKLRNPQRGKCFRNISEVWIDEESLAEMLEAKGLAGV
jgi:DNA-binding protein H-NS